MLAGALFLTACSHNSSLPPFTASGFAEDQGAVRIWRKDSGDNVHLLAVFSPWRSGDTTTREYRWQGDNLTLININVYSKPPVNIRARFDDRGDLSFMQRESDGESSSFLTTKSIYTVIVLIRSARLAMPYVRGESCCARGAGMRWNRP